MKKTVVTLACLFTIFPFWSTAQNWTMHDIVKKLKNSPDSYQKAELYYQLSKLKIGKQIDSAFYYAELSAEKATDIKSKPLLAKSYFLLGYLHEITGDVPNTLKYYIGAKRIYEDINDIPRVEDLDENLVKIAQDNNALEAAEFFASNRLNYLDDLPNFKRRADVYFDLGIIHIQSHKLIKANEFFWMALFEYQEHATIHDTVEYSAILLRLGTVQKKLGNIYADKEKYYDSATYFYSKSAAMNGSAINRIWYNNNMGSLLIDKDESELAINHLSKALQLEQHHKTARMLPYIFNNFGMVYYFQGKLDSAHYYFKQSVLSNIASKTPLENINDKANNVNFFNHNELKKSLAFMDTVYILNPALEPLDETVTAGYFMEYLEKQAALRNLKEEYIMSVALKENTLVANRLATKLEREKMIRSGGIIALLLSISLAVWFWIRVKRIHASMDEMFDYLEELKEEENSRYH